MKQKTLNMLIVTMSSILLISFHILVVASAMYYYEHIHIYAWASTQDDCDMLTDEQFQAGGYITGGTTSFTYNPDNTISNINVTIVNPEQHSNAVNSLIMKHEMCHVEQMKRGAIKPCDKNHNVFGRYINEAECYIKMYFPSNNE